MSGPSMGQLSMRRGTGGVLRMGGIVYKPIQLFLAIVSDCINRCRGSQRMQSSDL
jgi:hypothetical protein